MADPAANLADLLKLRESSAWQLVVAMLTDEIGKSLVPAPIAGDLNAIAIAAISRAATHASLCWVRDQMVGQMIERERKAAKE